MGMHRSTTPTTDSCSAPTSPASQNISPSNSPELPIHTNGGGGGNLGNNGQQQQQQMSQQFGMNGNSPNSYNSYSSHQHQQQQANILQHQLEQFRMTSDSEGGGGSSQTSYMVRLNIMPNTILFNI